tara:strand:- start:21 stop:293 length:273 start_codon:yes stop_codon:yes gene_type:complete
VIDANDIKKAREIIAEEIKSYTEQGMSEIATCRYLANKYDCYWEALQKLANQNFKSIKKSVETAEKILEKQIDSDWLQMQENILEKQNEN